MDAISAIRQYIDYCLRNPGIKVLLLDEHTTGVISLVYAQSQIFQKEVYLTDRIDNPNREIIPEARAVCFVRPTEASVKALCKEMEKPKYGYYEIYFSNVVDPDHLRLLASADFNHVIKEVQEVYADFFAIDPLLFSFNTIGCFAPRGWQPGVLEKMTSGLLAVLKAMQKQPSIRFQASSPATAQLADKISRHFPKDIPNPSCVLLIVDRRDDPLTPLSFQWTYQAMVHEILGINNNCVDLSDVPGIDKDMKQIILSGDQDEFFAENKYLTYGELLPNVDKLATTYKKTMSEQSQVETLSDMKRFFANYGQLKSISGSAGKHINCVHELRRQVNKRKLIDDGGVCDTEVEIITGDHSAAVKQITMHLQDRSVADHDKLRLVLLYILKYEGQRSNKGETFYTMLQDVGVPADMCNMVNIFMKIAGRNGEGRSSDCVKASKGEIYKANVELENPLLRRNTLLAQTLNELVQGKLSEKSYPFQNTACLRPKSIIVFIAGGATYEEAKTIDAFCKVNRGVSAVLGGTHIVNSRSFLQELHADM